MLVKDPGGNMLPVPVIEICPSSDAAAKSLFRKGREGACFSGNAVFCPQKVVSILKGLFLPGDKRNRFTAESGKKNIADRVILQPIAIVCDIRNGYDPSFHEFTHQFKA